ncbi:nucleoid-structuring protein H-NS [Mycobacterium spongiae]|uniref:Nucleoid-structuring protein H-NS n=1 Tax=Mycobacterium spongiae TaxID=886343 RepID=A0A975K2M9_9MYCO|nr:nucleoid-structuring protein H-NS [Mycobacterium spongiae]QUR69409.1 nucleoid-structuring protein H-NS [Mycobacterium spongiae]
MADPQDQPDSEPDGASNPPAKKQPVKKQPVKKAAKAPAKKAAAKKSPAKKAAAKKTPAKKPPAKKTPTKSSQTSPPKKTGEPVDPQQRIETNGQLAAGAKDVAAQAKSIIDRANDPLPQGESTEPVSHSPVPLVVAVALSLLAILLIRQLRRR